MGSLILISGENNSGKSKFAEKLVCKFDGNRYYIATMIPKTENNYYRIEKHKKQREDLKFTTLEVPYNLENVTISSNTTVLLEDVSNLLANNMFDKNKNADDVLNDILYLAEKSEVLVAVTISGLSENGYDEETATYIRNLNYINQKLSEKALTVIEMINKKPVIKKGENYDIY